MISRRQVLAAVVCSAAIAPAMHSHAQGIGRFPEKPLTLIVPYPTGGAAGYTLLLHPGTPLKAIADVVSAAKAKPAGLAYGSAGNGNTMHLAGELFQARSGAKLMHVPYKGGAPALNDVMAGQSPMMFNNLPAIVSLHNAGKIRVIAQASAKRSPLLPDVPTMAEAGLKDADSVVWNGMLMRKGTPPAIVEYLNKEMRAVLESDAFRAPLEAQGFEVLSSTPKAFETLLRQDHAQMGDLIRVNKIKIE